MLTINHEPEREDVLGEINALFEKSDLDGQVLWHPTLEEDDNAPDAVMFIKEKIRLAITVVPGRCSVKDGRWKVHDSDGGIPIKNPLERAWSTGVAVRSKLSAAVRVGIYVIPVVIFPHMDEDPDIIDACRRRKVRLVWGMDDDLVETLASLPEAREIQHQLSDRFIADEVAILRDGTKHSRSTSPAKASSEGKQEGEGIDLSGHSVIMHHVDQVVINIALPS